MKPTSSPSSSSPSDRIGGAAPWLTLGAAFLGWMFDGLEMGIFPLIARPALQDMLSVHNDQLVGVWMGWITAVFLLGAAAGGFVFGWLGDKIGRVRALAISILAYSLFTGLCYFARDPWHLAVLRFLAALGMGGEWSLGVALVMETWPSRHRPWLAGAIGAASNVGFLLVGAIAYFVPVTQTSWRWLVVVGAAPAVLTFFIRLFVPESEKWKTAVAGRKVEPVREIFDPGLRSRTFMAIVVSSIALIGTWGSVQWIPLWTDRLTGGVMPEAKATTGMLVAAGAIVGCIAGPLCGVFGRRLSYLIICLLSYASCSWLFLGTGGYGLQFQLLCFAVGATTAAFYGWLPLYLPELFPTRVRATAQGISYNFGRILAAAGAVGAGRLVELYDGNYGRMGATITLVYLVGMVVIWFGPETKGQPLPE